MKRIIFSLLFIANLQATEKKEYALNSAYLEASSETLYIGIAQINVGVTDSTGLYVYDVKKKSGSIIQMPDNLKGEHIIGIFPSSNKESLYILSQLRKAGTAKPSLSMLSLESKTFKNLFSELDCANVIKAHSLDSKLVLSCGHDANHPPAQKNLEIKVKNIAKSLTRDSIKWIPQEPNSLAEASSLILKSKSTTLRIEAKSLFK